MKGGKNGLNAGWRDCYFDPGWVRQENRFRSREMNPLMKNKFSFSKIKKSRDALTWSVQSTLAAVFVPPGAGKISGSKIKHISGGHFKLGGELSLLSGRLG